MKRILIGGSPCTYWSIIQNPKNRETQAEGQGWELFLNYVIAKEKFKPDYWIYENNESISKKIQAQITKNLEIETLLHFDSAAVSAQSRKRVYGSNILVPPPEDRGVTLADIIDEDVEPVTLTRPRFKEKQCRIYTNGKSPTITAAGGENTRQEYFTRVIRSKILRPTLIKIFPARLTFTKSPACRQCPPITRIC